MITTRLSFFRQMSFRATSVVLLILLFGAGRVLAQDPAAASFSSFQNTPVNSVLDIYEQLSGLHLIRDSNLSSRHSHQHQRHGS